MKKYEISSGPYMYPMSVIIAGANMGDKPNYTTVAFNGIVNFSPPMVAISLNRNSYINSGIKKHRAYSVNVPSGSMLKTVNYFGTVSGRNIDKYKKVSTFYSQSEMIPMIEECPVNLMCKLVKILDFGESNEIFIGEIIKSFCSSEFIIDGYPDIKKIDPILLTLDSMIYWRVGEVMGLPERIQDY